MLLSVFAKFRRGHVTYGGVEYRLVINFAVFDQYLVMCIETIQARAIYSYYGTVGQIGSHMRSIEP